MARSLNAFGQEVPVYAAPKMSGIVFALNAATNKLVDLVALWNYRTNYRRELAHMSVDMMADIGIDYVTAMKESRKPFWKA